MIVLAVYMSLLQEPRWNAEINDIYIPYARPTTLSFDRCTYACASLYGLMCKALMCLVHVYVHF